LSNADKGGCTQINPFNTFNGELAAVKICQGLLFKNLVIGYSIFDLSFNQRSSDVISVQLIRLTDFHRFLPRLNKRFAGLMLLLLGFICVHQVLSAFNNTLYI